MRDVTLVTGVPGFIGTRIARRLRSEGRRLALLVYPQPALLEKARDLDLGEVVPGDITKARLGLDEATHARLAAEVGEVWHLAALYDLAAPRATSVAVNVDGTRRVLDFCEDGGGGAGSGGGEGPRRLVYFSTMVVSGDRTGVVYEHELEMGQSFRNFYEETKHLAEVLVRRRAGLKPVIVRPAAVVGDSRSGEVDKYDGPYYMIHSLARLEARGGIGWNAALYSIGRAPAPFHLIPVDYLVEAATAIARRPGSAGRTFHVVDREPMSVEDFRSEVLQRFGAPDLRLPFPAGVGRALASIPAVERFFRVPRQVMDYLDLEVRYDDTNTRLALEGTGIRCPPMASYLDTLVAFVRSHLEIRPVLSKR